MAKYLLFLMVMQVDFNSKQVEKVKFIPFFLFAILFLKIYILATSIFLFVSNNVGDQLGAFIRHTLVTWVKLCFVVIGKHAIPFQICSKEGYIHL
jgi:hypothetical protein